MTRREFHLIEGDSRKFWSIELEEMAHTVQFGRIGTAGQTQRKEFTTAAEAKASYDRLIAEKLKKGYSETAGATAAKAGTAAPSPARAASASQGNRKGGTAPPPELQPAPPTVEEAPTSMPTDRSIDLDPQDWMWATWRKRPPCPGPSRHRSTSKTAWTASPG
jgi:predicted DNA-binding WGR domain protein